MLRRFQHWFNDSKINHSPIINITRKSAKADPPVRWNECRAVLSLRDNGSLHRFQYSLGYAILKERIYILKGSLFSLAIVLLASFSYSDPYFGLATTVSPTSSTSLSLLVSSFSTSLINTIV